MGGSKTAVDSRQFSGLSASDKSIAGLVYIHRTSPITLN